MESSEYTQSTLDLFRELFPEHENLGVVIQSYLRRSEDDVRRLCDAGASVRLCKGAYSEPEEVAYQRKRKVDENYLRLLEILISCQAPLAVATH
ncbi:MAG: proline dehydrogenase, partial [Gemmatimonadetes bacterium]|nr:proline dehydrogenase [Gemmatimonadota bacterium]NIT65482.1 proline dehydrogenase [Gemmatimonadota bacterium]NIW73953.1 proline dehydrogenase [Gemmatimonadota bacterium]NIY34060.1 proline dehydrogenase [Gemmatimonadota bacterium]